MQKNKLAEIFLALFLLTLSVFVPNRGNENKSVDFIELPKKINGIPAVPIKLNKEEKDFINSGDVKITKKKIRRFYNNTYKLREKSKNTAFTGNLL